MERIERPHATLTVWATVVGLLLYLLGQRRLGTGLMRVAGLGGVGMVYGHYAARHGLRVEPIPIFGRMMTNPLDDKDYLESLGFHAMIWAAAEVLDRRPC